MKKPFVGIICLGMLMIGGGCTADTPGNVSEDATVTTDASDPSATDASDAADSADERVHR